MESTTVWEEIGLWSLVARVEVARDIKKCYCFIQDYNGVAVDFYQYKGRLLDYHKEKIKVTLGAQTQEECIEVLRKNIVAAMRNGQTLAINLGNIKFDFTKEFNDEQWLPTEKIFDYPLWTDYDDGPYRMILKQGEWHMMHGLNEGLFYIDKKF